MSRMRSWPVVATPPACSTRKAIGKHCNTADVLEQLNQAQPGSYVEQACTAGHYFNECIGFVASGGCDANQL